MIRVQRDYSIGRFKGFGLIINKGIDNIEIKVKLGTEKFHIFYITFRGLKPIKEGVK